MRMSLETHARQRAGQLVLPIQTVGGGDVSRDARGRAGTPHSRLQIVEFSKKALVLEPRAPQTRAGRVVYVQAHLHAAHRARGVVVLFPEVKMLEV